MIREVKVAHMFKKSIRINIPSMGLKFQLLIVEPKRMYNFKLKKKDLSPLAGMERDKKHSIWEYELR